jgi:hypothetical protein
MLSLQYIKKAVSDWNLGFTRDENSKPDRRQRSSLNQELQNHPDVILVVTFIKCVNNENVRR